MEAISVPRPLVIVGCSGFGREVHDVVDAINSVALTWDVRGYIDDDPSEANLELAFRRGSTVLGGSAWLDDAEPEICYVLGIGSPTAKASLDRRFGDRSSPVLVHPQASIGFGVDLGAGTIVCAGARLTTNICSGRHVHVNLGSTVGHDVIIGAYVTINPLVAVSGNVTIGNQAMLGTHSCILQNLEIGSNSTVGGASLVTKSTPEGRVVKGVPAKAS